MQRSSNKSQFRLHRVHALEVEGLIFISLGKVPIPFDPAHQTSGALLKPQGSTARGARPSITSSSKLKLVWENNRECYHCNLNHPQYIKANFDHYTLMMRHRGFARKSPEVVARTEKKWAAAGLHQQPRQTGMASFRCPTQHLVSANRTPLVNGWVSESMDGHRSRPLMGDYVSRMWARCRITAQFLEPSSSTTA